MKIERCHVGGAPTALGAYCHATVFDDRLVFTAGLSGRDPKTNRVPGVVLDSTGKRTAYDIGLETRACLENLKIVLEGAGSSMRDVLEVSVFLTDMKDFEGYNRVYFEYFVDNPPARTTVGVSTLPGPLAIEIKAIAVRTGHAK